MGNMRDVTFSLFRVAECAYLATVCSQMCVYVCAYVWLLMMSHRRISWKDEGEEQK